jgi:hypothetical protein
MPNSEYLNPLSPKISKAKQMWEEYDKENLNNPLMPRREPSINRDIRYYETPSSANGTPIFHIGEKGKQKGV